MSKNLWITLIGIVIGIVSLALVLMLLLVPEPSSYITGVTYDEIAKNDYTYKDTKYDPQKEENWEMHEVNSSDIRDGQNKGTYVPGNTNPFTPPGDLTIYNEPGFVDEDGNTYSPEDSGTNGNTGSNSGTTK